MCSHCIFFFQIWRLGGWNHPLKTDRMVSSNLSWWLREHLPEQKCIWTVPAEQTSCLHFQEAIIPESSQVWYRTASALFYMVSRKYLTSMIANTSAVFFRGMQGVCPRLTQSASLWSLIAEEFVNYSSASCTTKAPIHSLTNFPSSTENGLAFAKICLSSA